MALKAGHCTGCQKPVWRSVAQQKDAHGKPAGTEHILWPHPTSMYAKLKTDTGHAPGIAYCPDCAPAIGEQCPAVDNLEVCGYESAKARYAFWYSDGYGAFLRSYLADAMFLDAAAVADMLALWERDRATISA